MNAVATVSTNLLTEVSKEEQHSPLNLADVNLSVKFKLHKNCKVGGFTFDYERKSCSFHLPAPACKFVKLVILKNGDSKEFKLTKNERGIFEICLSEKDLEDSVENLSKEGIYYYYRASRDGKNYESLPDPYAPGLLTDCSPFKSIAQDVRNLLPNKAPKIPEESLKIAEINILNYGHDAKFSEIASDRNIKLFKDAGINCLQIMPCMASISENSLLENNLENLWGYNILSMFAYDTRKFDSKTPLEIRKEIIETINKLHDNGIQVILDLVTAHTSSEYPLLSILTDAYYHNSGKYDGLCYSGCGNSVNTNSQVGRALVKNAILEMLKLFDGVRLDQGSILGRDANGEFRKQQKLLRIVSNIAKKLNKIIIFEDNDRAGHVGGSFPPTALDTNHSIGWALGQYYDNHAVLPASKNPNDRNTVDAYYLNTGNLYWDGELKSAISVLADIISGSRNIYREHTQNRGIRILSSHDGFTTWDLSNLIAKANNDDTYHIFKAQVASYLFSPGNIFIPATLLMAHSQNGDSNGYCGVPDKAKLNFEAINTAGSKENYAYNLISKAIELRNELGIFDTMSFMTSEDVSWYGCDGAILEFADLRWNNDTTKVLQALYKNKDNNKPDVLVVHSGNINNITLPSEFITEPDKIELVFDSTKHQDSFATSYHNPKDEFELKAKGVLVFKIHKKNSTTRNG